jgi:hypothetical protein
LVVLLPKGVVPVHARSPLLRAAAGTAAFGRPVTFPPVKARALLTQLNLGRVVLGTGLIARPRSATSMWVGRDGHRPGGQVLARALGARDAALGAGTLVALRSGQPLLPWVVGGLFCDATDLLATHAARERLPRGAAPLIYLLAGGALVAGLANVADSQAPQA